MYQRGKELAPLQIHLLFVRSGFALCGLLFGDGFHDFLHTQRRNALLCEHTV
jgi:hypothetical protein